MDISKWENEVGKKGIGKEVKSTMAGGWYNYRAVSQQDIIWLIKEYRHMTTPKMATTNIAHWDNC